MKYISNRTGSIMVCLTVAIISGETVRVSALHEYTRVRRDRLGGVHVLVDVHAHVSILSRRLEGTVSRMSYCDPI